MVESSVSGSGTTILNEDNSLEASEHQEHLTLPMLGTAFATVDSSGAALASSVMAQLLLQRSFCTPDDLCQGIDVTMNDYGVHTCGGNEVTQLYSSTFNMARLIRRNQRHDFD